MSLAGRWMRWFVSRLVLLFDLTARPPKVVHLVFESHDGRALVPIPKRSASP